MKMTSSPLFRRLGIFILGVFLLAVPDLVVQRAIREAEEAAFQYRLHDATERNKAVLGALNNQEIVTNLQDSNLQKYGRMIASAAFATPETWPTPGGLKNAATAGLAFLRTVGIQPLGLYLVYHRWEPGLSSPTIEVMPLIPGTFSEPTRHFLSAFVGYLTQSYYVSYPPGLHELNALAPSILGVSNDINFYRDEFRGKSAPVIVEKQAGYLYWQPVVPPHLTELIGAAEQKPTDRADSEWDFPLARKKQFLLGGFLALLPRDPSRAQKARTIALSFEDPQTAFALVASETTERFCTRNFPKDRLGSAPPEPTPDSRLNEVWSTDSIELEKTYSVLITSRIKPPEPETSRRHSVILVCTHLALFVGSLLWLSAIFLDIGLTSFLAGQLGWGFILASLLPLATTFFIVELLAEEKYESLLKKNRLELLQELHSVENRFLFHHSRIWRMFEKVSQNRSLVKVLDDIRGAKQATPASLRRLDTVLEKAFHFVQAKMNKLAVRSIIIAGPRGINRFFSEDSVTKKPSGNGFSEGSESVGLSELLGAFGEKSLAALRSKDDSRDTPEDQPPTQEGKPKMDRRDFLMEFGTKYILSLFGPEGFFNIIFGFGHPFEVNSGAGNWFLANFLAPSAVAPRFLVQWLYLGKYTDEAALKRILSRPGPRFKIFGFERTKFGFHPYPESGERFPFLRPIAHQVITGGNRVSISVEFKGETYQVEGIPIYSSNQFVLIGIAPESHLKEKIGVFRFQRYAPLLFAIAIALVLSVFASLDILYPLELLKRGMDAIHAGTYSFRLSLRREDELGEVMASFNGMARGLEEAQLMGKMVSSSARKALLDEKSNRAGTEGERRDVTIVYFGVPDVEQFSKGVDPQVFFTSLNQQIRFICQAIVGHQGDIDKIIGDKVLAFFAHGSDGKRAAVRKAMDTLKTIVTAGEQGHLPFPIAAGVNSGTVISGFLGSGSRRDYTIIGDPVNVAARAESLAEKLSGVRVIITGEVREALDPAIVTQTLDVTSVKGKEKELLLARISW